MQIKSIVIANPGRMATGARRTALLAPSVAIDAYQVNERWFGVDRYKSWHYGRTVDAIKYGGTFLYARGDILAVEGFTGQVGCYAEVVEIRMVDAEHITDEDIALLGYSGRDEWLEQTNEGLGGRRSWLLVVDVLEADEIDDEPSADSLVEIDILRGDNRYDD